MSEKFGHMNGYVNCSDMLEILDNMLSNAKTNEEKRTIGTIWSQLVRARSGKVEPVIKCKNCAHYMAIPCGIRMCTAGQRPDSKDFFCKHGEERF